MTERWRRAARKDARLAFIQMLLAASPRLTALLGASLLLEAALTAGFALASGELVGAVPDTVRGGLASPAGNVLVAALAAVVAAFILRQALEPFQGALLATLGRRLQGRFRERAMWAALGPAGIAHLEDPANQDLLARVRGAVQGQYTPAQALRGLVNLSQKALTALTSTALIWVYYRWWLAVWLLLALLVARSRLRRDVFRAVAVMTGTTAATRRADYFLGLALEPSAAKETRVFGLAGWVMGRFRLHWLEAMEPVWVERRAGTWAVGPWVVAAVFLPVLATFALIGSSAARGEIGLSALTVIAQAVLNMTAWLFSINLPEQWFEYGVPSATALAELEAMSAESYGERKEPRTRRHGAEGLPRRSIRFEGVSFRYPRSKADICSGLDLEIPAGRSVAIVGANGAGKTTVIKLLTGIYEPTAGRITVDGRDVRELELEGWRRRVAVIFQDFVRYELPASDNVGFGAVERSANREMLSRAAERAGALGIVESLPRGWDTVLSREYEGGAELSGGQWQRVALARALFAVEAGAGVLVLDEPTAALDVRAEAELFDRFLELTRGLTTLLISHRFSTVRRADLIYVLDGGRVTERGGHEELLAKNGTYARMFRLQAARFLDEEPIGG